MFRRALILTALLASAGHLAAEELRLLPTATRLAGEPATVSAKAGPGDKDTFTIVYDDGEADNGLQPGNFAFLYSAAMQFDLPDVPVTVDEIEVCFTRTGADSELPFSIQIWAANGPGGAPGTEIARAGALASGVPAGFSMFYTYDVSGLEIEIGETPVYIGVTWTPAVDNNFFLCSDWDAPVVHPGYQQVDLAAWQDLTDIDPNYTALMVRGTFTTIDEVRLSDVSGLIVPGFEVDTEDAAGPTTFFGVRNGTDDSVDIEVAYHGEEVTDAPLRTDAFTIAAQQTLPINVRTDLSGLNVMDGLATGVIVVTETGGTTAPNLEGDYYRVDFSNDFATGDRLVRPVDFCQRQEIRFVDFGSGSQLRVLVNRPLGVAEASFSYTAYDEAGAMVASGDFFTSDHLSVLDVGELVTGDSFGTILFDFANVEGGWVSARYSAFGRFSLELNAACLDG